MKNIQLIIAGLVLVIVISSCTKKPEVSFTVTKTTAAVNEEITATSTSIDANSHTWFFYEGIKESVQQGSSTPHVSIVSGGFPCEHNFVTFKFDSVGTYTVLLNACNWKDGCGTKATSGFCDIATEIITIQ